MPDNTLLNPDFKVNPAVALSVMVRLWNQSHRDLSRAHRDLQISQVTRQPLDIMSVHADTLRDLAEETQVLSFVLDILTVLPAGIDSATALRQALKVEAFSPKRLG